MGSISGLSLDWKYARLLCPVILLIHVLSILSMYFDLFLLGDQQAFEFQSGEMLDSSSAEANGGNTFPTSPTKRPPTDAVIIGKAELATLLDEKLDRFATKSNIDHIVEQARSNAAEIQDNRRDISSIKNDIAELKEANKISKLREVVSSVLRESPLTTGDKHGGRFEAGAKFLKQEVSRIKKYNSSRCSLRIWPVEGDNPSAISASLKKFLTDKIGINPTDIPCLGIKWVERVRLAPKAKINSEVRVSFSSATG